jgi:hypothetical protein
VERRPPRSFVWIHVSALARFGPPRCPTTRARSRLTAYLMEFIFTCRIIILEALARLES